MSTASDTPARLTVRRLCAQYLVPASHPDPGKVRSRLDGSLNGLGQMLGSALSSELSVSDESVWMIRRLDVQFDVNVAWSRHVLERQWARHLARQLCGALWGDGDGHNAIRFPTRAAYLASYLSDAACGTAPTAWYYRPFEGLRLLACGDALRTAICRSPREGLDALRHLDCTRLTHVVRALSDQNAKVVLAEMAQVEAPQENAAVGSFEVACACLLQLRRDGVAALTEPREALRLFVHALREAPAQGGAALRTAVAALVRLERRLREEAPQILTAVDCGTLADLYRVAGAADAEVLQPLLGVPHELRRHITSSLAPTLPVPERAPQTLHTPFGGAVMLMPQVDRVSIDWPLPEGIPSGSVLRLLVLSKCMVPGQAREAFHDPVLRRLLDVPEDFSLEDPASWTSRVVGGFARRLLRDFARRLPGFARSGFEYLRKNFLDFPASLQEDGMTSIIRLGRPPLHLVLSLTGINRGTHSFSWLPGRTVSFYPQE